MYKSETEMIEDRIKREGGWWVVTDGQRLVLHTRTRTQAIHALGEFDHRRNQMWDLICLLGELGHGGDEIVEHMTGDYLGYELEELRDLVCTPQIQGWTELKQAIVDALAAQEGGAA